MLGSCQSPESSKGGARHHLSDQVDVRLPSSPPSPQLASLGKSYPMEELHWGKELPMPPVDDKCLSVEAKE